MAYNYDVDIILVIDTTSSMTGLIDLVKSKALTFCEDLKKKMTSYQKNIDSLRVMAISFKDFYGDGAASLTASPFFNLPAENTNLSDFVNRFSARGGHSAAYPHDFDSSEACPPESGLEALAYSILKVDYSKNTSKRNIIVLWTDAYAHPLEHAHLNCPNYPIWMPKSIQELTSAWGQKMDISSKRLILFTPDVYPWSLIVENWENVIQHVTKTAGISDLPDDSYKTILETIVNSI